MKIAIVGVGAMGSVYAGLLANAGHEVWAIDTWAEHVEAMKRNGLRVEGASGDHTVPINAATGGEDVGPCDHVVIATKAMHVEAAAASAAQLVGPDTVVVSIQNGLGGPDKAAAALPQTRVAIGVVGGFGASMIGPGHVHHNGWELVRFGEPEGPASARLEKVAAAWGEAGFSIEVSNDIQKTIWQKLICNVTFSGTCGLTELTIGEVMGNDDTWQVASGCGAEAYRVARAKGIALDFDDPVAYVRAFGGKIPHARPSLLLDLLAGRQSEIDVINGAIPVAGAPVDVAAPVNRTVTALVRAKEHRLGLR